MKRRGRPKKVEDRGINWVEVALEQACRTLARDYLEGKECTDTYLAEQVFGVKRETLNLWRQQRNMLRAATEYTLVLHQLSNIPLADLAPAKWPIPPRRKRKETQ